MLSRLSTTGRQQAMPKCMRCASRKGIQVSLCYVNDLAQCSLIIVDQTLNLLLLHICGSFAILEFVTRCFIALGLAANSAGNNVA